MAELNMAESDFVKLGILLEGWLQQKSKGTHVVLIERLDQILEEFGLRFCRSPTKAVDSWHYDTSRPLQSNEPLAFSVGELYILLETAKEVQAAYRSSPIWRKLVQLVPKKPAVFLGGTCSTTTWRQDVVVPFCRANDFDYFDPQAPARNWSQSFIHVEERAKLESSAFIFYVSSAARSLTSMIEVAYLVARRKNLIAVVSRVPVRIGDSKTDTSVNVNSNPTDSNVSKVTIGNSGSDSAADSDSVTAAEQNELSRARDALVRLAESNGYPVFETLQDALRSCATLIRERAEVDELIGKHAVLPLELVAARYRDRLLRLRSAFSSCNPTADRIPFAQAYSLLQQACARENVSCIRLPQGSRRALLSLLDRPNSSPGATSPTHHSLQSNSSDSDRNEPEETAVGFVSRATQVSSEVRQKEGGNNVIDKLLTSVGRRSAAVIEDEALEQRLVSFDEVCFLFGRLLEFELERRDEQCVVFESLGNLAEFFRVLVAFFVDRINKRAVRSSTDGDPDAAALPLNIGVDVETRQPRTELRSASSSSIANSCRCNHNQVDKRRPARSETVHLRGATEDRAIFADLIIPLLARHSVPFCLDGTDTSDRRDRCACDCDRSRLACRELPDVVRMAMAEKPPVTTVESSTNAIHAVDLDNRGESLCSRLRDRFSDRLRYQCPFAQSRLVLFAFTRQAKSVVEMIQCAQCIGENAAMHRRVLLFVEMFEPGDSPDGELLNNVALKDYNRVRLYLLSMAKSHEHETVRIADSRDELLSMLATELGFHDRDATRN